MDICSGCAAGGKSPHTLECLYQHFLSYTNQVDTPELKQAYKHGYDAGKPSWMPIGTAPRDGTTVLLYDGAGYGSGSWKAYASGHGEWQADWGNYYTYEPDATHWMPLPPMEEV